MNRNTSYSFVVSQSGNYTVIAYATPYNSLNGEGSLTDTQTINVTENTFTVTFDAAIGSCNVKSKIVTYGSTYGDLPIPVKEGYDFTGWYDGSTKITSNSIVTLTSNIMLTANWTVKDNVPDYPVADYYADINLDGRISVFDTTQIRQIASGEMIPTVLEKIYSDLDADGDVDADDVEIIVRIYHYTMNDSMVQQSLANWKKKYIDTEYIIEFEADDFELTIKQGHKYETLPTPTKKGYVFEGWYTDKDVKITSDSVFITSDYGLILYPYCVLYANWTANNYKVSFDANGGSCGTSSKIVTFDSTYETLPTPTRTGYVFTGWYTSQNSGTLVTSDTKVAITSDQTLYARWTTASYTVSFDANGGSCSTLSKSVNFGSTYGTLPTPTRTGYVFTGWYTSQNSGTLVTSDTKVAITSDQTLYARWTTASYTVSFDANGGSCSTLSKSVNFGSTYGTLPTPTRTGYVFTGWYTGQNSGTLVTSNTEVAITYNQTLYARWIADSYTISFDANGGSCTTKSTTVVFDSTYGTLPTPVRIGFTFDGWRQYDGTVVTNNTEVSIASNHTLYARWLSNKYNVSFNVNGGVCNVSSKSVSFNSAYGTLPTPIRTGYMFLGWYTGKYRGTEVTTDTIYSITSNQILYAHWEQNVTVSTVTLAGDTNGDGAINIADVVVISAYIGDPDKNSLTEQQLANADVHATGNGVNANDALMIQQYLANIIDKLT